ncbi:MAG: trypsin-like peptidase domain-containing protein [Bacteroidota bacterium]
MKNLGLIVVVSLVSAFFSIGIYRYFEEPQKVVVQESAPAVYANYTEPISNIDISPRKFLSSSPTNFIAAAESVTPAVVNIKTSGEDYGFWVGSSFNGASGSGVLISSDGYIVTNNHVIEDGKKIEITLNDRRSFDADLIGIDPSTDLALLKVKGKSLPFIDFGNSDSIRVGEWVLAVGNPFNLNSTVTAGIVSAKGRNIDILEDNYSVESFIQTDAAVNPGNSGGALVNTNGELIGINTAIITRSGRYEGYSFAIPANLVRKIVKDIKDYGIVQRAILGVSIDDVDEELAEELGLGSIAGVYIKRVTPNSGAEDGGIRRNDVITSINGIETPSSPELQEQVARYRPGNTIEVEFIRSGKKRKTRITLKNKSNTTSLVGSTDESVLDKLGVELRNLSKSERRRLQTEGVMVKSIIRGSKIERTNMDPGFIITKVNDARVGNVEEVIQALKGAKGEVLLEGIYENYPGEWGYKFSTS